jgi:formylglycine-generating enzyme required for sulfatase activity
VITVSSPLKAESLYREPTTGMEFVLISGGCFSMGDTFDVGEQDEKPVHQVCVDDFYLGKYEVTQKEWSTLMNHNPAAYPFGERYPVEWISWLDAREFIKRLNGLSEEQFRLPTEAEWEYACRAGGEKIRFGTLDGLISPDKANYGNGSFGEGDNRDGYEFTSPVGSYPPNALGLYDMSGNVFEWVSDWKSLNKNYYQVSPVRNPQGIENSTRKVGRGGSWNFGSDHQRCSNRFSNWPRFRCLSYGFRILKLP